MEIVRRPTRLSELPVHPQLLRYLAQAGEFFAVVAEGTEYERDVIPRFPGRALSPDYEAVTFFAPAGTVYSMFGIRKVTASKACFGYCS